MMPAPSAIGLQPTLGTAGAPPRAYRPSPLAYPVCMPDGLDKSIAELEAAVAELRDTLTNNAKQIAELKVRLTELAGIAAAQAMSIEEKLDEVLRRLPPERK
jgi:hypothetical protein